MTYLPFAPLVGRSVAVVSSFFPAGALFLRNRSKRPREAFVLLHGQPNHPSSGALALPCDERTSRGEAREQAPLGAGKRCGGPLRPRADEPEVGALEVPGGVAVHLDAIERLALRREVELDEVGLARIEIGHALHHEAEPSGRDRDGAEPRLVPLGAVVRRDELAVVGVKERHGGAGPCAERLRDGASTGDGVVVDLGFSTFVRGAFPAPLHDRTKAREPAGIARPWPRCRRDGRRRAAGGGDEQHERGEESDGAGHGGANPAIEARIPAEK